MRRLRWILLLAFGTLVAPSREHPVPATTAYARHVSTARRTVGSLAPINSSFIDALKAVPAQATGMTFTDWSTIKRYLGVPGLTSQSPHTARIQFLVKLFPQQGTLSYAAYQYPGSDPSLWGWDATDLLWETTVYYPYHPTRPNIHAGSEFEFTIFRLPNTFDFAPMMQLYRDRRFRVTSYHGSTIYSRSPFDRAAGAWANSLYNFDYFDFSAVLPKQHMLIVAGPDAGNEDPVQHSIIDTILGSTPSMATVSSVQQAVQVLGPIASAAVERNTCHVLRQSSTPAGVHAYDTLAIGYQTVQHQALGAFALAYGRITDAQSDLPLREHAVATATLHNHQPLARYMQFSHSAIIDGTVLLQTHFTMNAAANLINFFDDNDMAFAGC